VELGFIPYENLRLVIHWAINQNLCAISTVGAVTGFMQYFIVVAVFLVFENFNERVTAQFVLLM